MSPRRTNVARWDAFEAAAADVHRVLKYNPGLHGRVALSDRVPGRVVATVQDRILTARFY